MRSFLLVILILCVSISSPAAEVQYGLPRSPIHVEPAPKEASYLRSSPQIEKLQSYKLNEMTPSRVELSALSDDVELGIPIRNRLVWLLSYRDMPIRNEKLGKLVRIEINVAIDAESGRLLMAFTPPKNRWAVPMAAERNLDEASKSMLLRFQPVIPDSISHDIAGIIASIWESEQLDPTAAGQIILRPRLVGKEIPPHIMKDFMKNKRGNEGQVQALDVDKPMWIVEVKGTRWERGRSYHVKDFYFTGLMVLVDAVTMEPLEFSYIP